MIEALTVLYNRAKTRMTQVMIDSGQAYFDYVENKSGFCRKMVSGHITTDGMPRSEYKREMPKPDGRSYRACLMFKEEWVEPKASLVANKV
ncbi:hypothetical protein DRO91_06560 [Candidatus Heimdallarchaeota archaeon]|nr:MAG: hypothetical protein DRO91_06560 [Candidatus Heimdallarchaeota archaeon]